MGQIQDTFFFIGMGRGKKNISPKAKHCILITNQQVVVLPSDLIQKVSFGGAGQHVKPSLKQNGPFGVRGCLS